MTIRWPAALVGAIARRRAVVLIGSGVSANAISELGRRPPTWGAFLEIAYRQLDRRIPHIIQSIKQYRYLEACDYLKSEFGAGWNELIRAQFIDPQYKPANIHAAIFDLDVRIVVSMNFDKIYESYAAYSSEGTLIIKNYYDSDVRQCVAGSDRYLLKPHGTVDSMSNLIFTLDEYATARTKHAHFYEIMNALLHTHTFLCIGCGLSDPDLQLLFEDYKYRHNENAHYMLLPSPVAEQKKALILKTRGITVINYSPKDTHKELTDELVRLGELANAKRDEIAELRNW